MPIVNVREHERAGHHVNAYQQNRSRKGAKVTFAGFTLAGVVMAGTDGTTLLGIGADGASFPSLPDISVTKESDKSGKASSQTWEQQGIKYLEHAAQHELSCLTAAHGQVQQFLTTTPCRSLRRYIFAGKDASGNTAVVSLVKVEMYDDAQATTFKHLLDLPGTGDITPLGATVLKSAGITFTALHYASKQDGPTVIIAEAEPYNGPSTPTSLKQIATVAIDSPIKETPIK
jgi:hypothetical protein